MPTTSQADKVSQYTVQKGETAVKFMMQMVMLMQGDEFITCRNLTVLYLYDNTLTRIPLLDRNVNLSHLYLQNNKIENIEGLSSLARLTKL